MRFKRMCYTIVFFSKQDGFEYSQGGGGSGKNRGDEVIVVSTGQSVNHIKQNCL